MTRSLLKDIKLEVTPSTEILEKHQKFEEQIEARDQSVINYLKIRGHDRDFRQRVNEALAPYKSRRGPRPDGLAPQPFFELIRAIKKAYKLRSISAALEAYCELHDLLPEKASSLEDKYRRGRKERTQKRGGLLK